MSVTKIYIPAEEVSDYLEAALNGNTTEISVMLNRRWYMVDVPSEDNETALMLAAWNSNVETVQMLCQHRASTFAKNDDFEDVFDQVPNMDKAEKKKLDLVLQGARNEEIDSWNVGYQEHNRVMYEKDKKEGGVWCSFTSAGSISLSYKGDSDSVDSAADMMCVA